MTKRQITLSARNSSELAELLDLDPVDALELEFRSKLNLKLIQAVNKLGLTHAGAAIRVKSSRTRMTAILNGNTAGISTDRMLRMLYALGYKTKVTFLPSKLAA